MFVRAEPSGSHLVASIEGRSGSPLPPRDRSDNVLASLSPALSSRYCAWRGASDRRYVTSVYRVDRATGDLGLPAFEDFVLLAVGPAPTGRRILMAAAMGRACDRKSLIARSLLLGADEWHVHFLAETRQERVAVAADLMERHAAALQVRCA